MYHFIVNPIAKGGKLNKEWDNLQKYIEGKISNYKVHMTEYHGHSIEIVKELTNTNKSISIIAVGGDGTINEVINGIVNYEVTTIGYVPFGSGMDFARGNRIPLDPFKAINLIVKGNTKRVKSSKIIVDNNKERRFASNCGIGFDAEISAEASIEKTRMKKLLNTFNLGTLTYVYLVIKQLFTFKRLKLNIKIDGASKNFKNAWFITFCNNPYVGGGMKMNPKAIPEEQILDATIASDLSRFEVLTIFPTIFKGTHINRNGVDLLKGKEYEVVSDCLIEAHVDGEVIGKYNHFIIRLQDETIKIYA